MYAFGKLLIEAHQAKSGEGDDSNGAGGASSS
jgi:hypothetical protein